MATPYRVGESFTPAEANAVYTSWAEVEPRIRKMDRFVLLLQFQTKMPLRFEHEVNKLRGLAFDIGEHGSSYSKGGK